MIENKTRSDILLEERIAQIDDINFDKIYDIKDFAEKQIESFDETDADVQDLNLDLDNEIAFDNNFSEPEQESVFEMELQPNEFLDNYVWSKQEEEVEVVKKEKFHVANKPLFFTFTSIAILLCILFIYNVFVINSLESATAKSATALNANANISYVVENENNCITFENSSTMEIENNANTNFIDEESEPQITNWFDSVCNYVNMLFGGNY